MPCLLATLKRRGAEELTQAFPVEICVSMHIRPNADCSWKCPSSLFVALHWTGTAKICTGSRISLQRQSHATCITKSDRFIPERRIRKRCHDSRRIFSHSSPPCHIGKFVTGGGGLKKILWDGLNWKDLCKKSIDLSSQCHYCLCGLHPAMCVRPLHEDQMTHTHNV